MQASITFFLITNGKSGFLCKKEHNFRMFLFFSALCSSINRVKDVLSKIIAPKYVYFSQCMISFPSILKVSLSSSETFITMNFIFEKFIFIPKFRQKLFIILSFSSHLILLVARMAASSIKRIQYNHARKPSSVHLE